MPVGQDVAKVQNSLMPASVLLPVADHLLYFDDCRCIWLVLFPLTAMLTLSHHMLYKSLCEQVDVSVSPTHFHIYQVGDASLDFLHLVVLRCITINVSNLIHPAGQSFQSGH